MRQTPTLIPDRKCCSRDVSKIAPCPRCALMMTLAAVTPHQIATHIKRHTFLCAKRSRTKAYMLPANDAIPVWSEIGQMMQCTPRACDNFMRLF